MARGLMVVLAFAATAAQAQETTKAAEGTERAVLVESEQPAMVLASRLAPQPAAGPLSLKAGSRDGGADAGPAAGEGTSDKLADCSVDEAMLEGGVLPAIRGYPPPPPASSSDRKELAYVRAVIHTGRCYILQVRSEWGEPWAIKQARLEGQNGEVLQVHSLRFRPRKSYTINLIVAEVPPGVEVTSLKLDLTGADGRVAQLEAGDLP